MLRLAAVLDKQKFAVNYMWCIPGHDIRSGFTHPQPTVSEKEDALLLLRNAGVNAVEFQVKERFIEHPHLPWLGTNFWDVFNTIKTDVVYTWRSGFREYPFCHMQCPVIEWNVFGWYDPSPNILKSLAISPLCQRDFLARGGDINRSEVVYLPLEDPVKESCIRSELGIGTDELVIGMHQRREDTIFSPIVIEALRHLQYSAGIRFRALFLGGSKMYESHSKDLGITGIFLPPNNTWTGVSRFLKTLDIYAHARRDGETLGAAIQEAMMHRLPIVSHKAQWNAHIETIGSGGIVCDGQADYNQALAKLCVDVELRRSMGELGYFRANALYRWPGIIEKIEGAILGAHEESQLLSYIWTPLPHNIYVPSALLYYRVRRLFLNSINRCFIYVFGAKGGRILFGLSTGIKSLFHRFRFYCK